MEEKDNLTDLGHVISNKGGNMLNIIHKRNKAIGTEKLILRLIKNLGPYTFKGVLIYIQSLIRTSILYSAETMYNMSETEIRALEQISASEGLWDKTKLSKAYPLFIMWNLSC